MGWYGVRHVIKWDGRVEDVNSYEERVTLWRADSFEDAIRRAETEAAEHVKILGDGEVLDVFQAYLVTDDPGSVQASTAESVTSAGERDGVILEGESGLEVFSLIRDSHASPKEYVDRFFDTGTEHQGKVP
jgi:hypothetical protein